MKRYNTKLWDYVDKPEIDNFLEEIWKVCEKHGFAISHEDGHGAFEVVLADKSYKNWLMGAMDCTGG